ncbi:hypothetical protein [Neorhodopirellula lusitana]|nr:hypothetical protein [Neorhodopirellula lusitana]
MHLNFRRSISLTPYLLAIILPCLLASSLTAQSEVGVNVIGKQSMNVGISVVPAPGRVVIDGDLNEWDRSGEISSFADVDLRDRYSVGTSAMWDRDSLYLAIDWKDPTPMANFVDASANPDDGWKGDAIQLRIRSGAERLTHLTGWYDTQRQRPAMTISHQRGGGGVQPLLAAPGSNDIGLGIREAFKESSDGKGYIQEIAIPWSVLFEKTPVVTAGLTIRLGVEWVWGDPESSNWPAHRYADNLQPGKTSREFFWKSDDVWGDAKLLGEGNVEKRQYIVASDRLKGCIPVQATVPMSAKRFTLAINDIHGNRIRNLIADTDPIKYSDHSDHEQITVNVMWDGLDDDGKLVGPGEYRVVGLSHEGLDARYDTTYYNPGTTPWETAPGTGAWGADHGPPSLIASSGDWSIIGWHFAEGGSGIIGVGPDGRKAWGEKRGALALAADESHVYAIASGWHSSGTLIRLGKSDGSYQPFVLDGVQRPFELKIQDLLDGGGSNGKAGSEPSRTSTKDAFELGHDAKSQHGVAALAVYADRLALALPSGVALLDAQSAEFQQAVQLPGMTMLAFGQDGGLLASDGSKLLHWNPKSGKVTQRPTPGVTKITALAVDNQGNTLVFDTGPDQQVKAFTPDGKQIYAVGKPGGRPNHGIYDPRAMHAVHSIAVTSDGKLWTVENSDSPRRVAVWNRDGGLVHDYIGNSGYAGHSGYLHATDPNVAFIGNVEMALHRSNEPNAGRYQVKRILWDPNADKHEAFPLWPIKSHWFSSPYHFFSDASGKRREYLFVHASHSFDAVYMPRGDHWQPVSALVKLSELPNVIRENVFPDVTDKAGLIWNDANDDGAIQRDECEIATEGLPLKRVATDWGRRPGADLSLYSNGGSVTGDHPVRYQPDHFTPNGAPVYRLAGIKQLDLVDEGDLMPVPGENRLLMLSFKGFPNKTTGMISVDPDTSEIQWTYPNLYPSVHGSHRAPMPKPGLTIGPLRILGTADVGGDAGNVFALRGNLGQDFYFTTDGIYIGAMFQDTRLPAPSLPDTESELREVSLNQFTGGGEPFSGWMGKHDDGKVRVLTSMARQAVMVAIVEGLDTIHRTEPMTLKVDRQMLAQAELMQKRSSNHSSIQLAQQYTIKRIDSSPMSSQGKPDKPWAKIPVLDIASSSSPYTGQAQIAYDTESLYLRYDVKDTSPWINDGKDFKRLFKTGDVIDFQIATNSQAAKDRVEPEIGDMRVLIAPFGNSNVAVLMQPLVAGEPDASQSHQYVSPVQPRLFQRVALIQEARIQSTRLSDHYVVEAAIPFASLGFTPSVGTPLRGDLGFISSNESGNENTARTYWGNQQTNLVNDEPAEAWLYPVHWRKLIFGE